MALFFSFIIPVYNRPEEIKELLASMAVQDYNESFEVVIVEDGSTDSSEEVIKEFQQELYISYYKKPNSGPGDSRNYGMGRAKGDYFIILDSDCILPPQYLKEVASSLKKDYVHCYGGPDAAHETFSDVQKAINYAMTSVLTTGGIRGNKNAVGKFQPRSFNMGISKQAFEKTGGFGNIHPGEDPDLTIRIWNEGFETKLIPEAFVYHKRRIDWDKFLVQVTKFGMVRPILNKWHPKTAKLAYWFPAIFCLGLVAAIALLFFNGKWPLFIYVAYFVILFMDSLLKNKSIKVASLSMIAVIIQFYGYGRGFLKSTVRLNLDKGKPEQIFPNLFFKASSAR